MSHSQQCAPPAICSLANHLDAALAACEDLLKLQGVAADTHSVLRLELTAITHVLQARQGMKEVRLEDSALASQFALFVAGTALLEDVTSRKGSAESLEAADHEVSIGRCIPVATLMALAASMLDALEVCFVLYDDETNEDPFQASPPVITEALVWASSPD